MTPTTVDLRLIRAGAPVMAGVALAWPLLPHPPLCPLLATTGVPCPLCGATRSVVSALRGSIRDSLTYSPIGIVVIACVIAALVLWRQRTLTIRAWPIIAMLSVTWAYNLTMNPTFD